MELTNYETFSIALISFREQSINQERRRTRESEINKEWALRNGNLKIFKLKKASGSFLWLFEVKMNFNLKYLNFSNDSTIQNCDKFYVNNQIK